MTGLSFRFVFCLINESCTRPKYTTLLFCFKKSSFFQTSHNKSRICSVCDKRRIYKLLKGIKRDWLAMKNSMGVSNNN